MRACRQGPVAASQVLRECYFAVAAGDLHMVLGANGCGKSTLLRAAGGLASVGAGSVATAQPAGFVFQNPDHQVVLPTAGADVAFGLGGCAFPLNFCSPIHDLSSMIHSV